LESINQRTKDALGTVLDKEMTMHQLLEFDKDFIWVIRHYIILMRWSRQRGYAMKVLQTCTEMAWFYDTSVPTEVILKLNPSTTTSAGGEESLPSTEFQRNHFPRLEN